MLFNNGTGLEEFGGFENSWGVGIQSRLVWGNSKMEKGKGNWKKKKTITKLHLRGTRVFDFLSLSQNPLTNHPVTLICAVRIFADKLALCLLKLE